MPRTPLQNKEIKERRKNEILKKSLELFSKYGYKNVSMDDISKAVKCSHGLLYHYFDSKEVLIDELEKISREKFNNCLDETIEKFEPGIDALKNILKYMLNMLFSSDENTNTLLCFIGWKLRTIEKGSNTLSYAPKYYSYFKKIFKVLLEEGKITKDFDVNSYIVHLLCYFNGLAICKTRYKNVDLIKPYSTFLDKNCINID